MISTERLILKPIALTDAAFVLKLLNTEGWINNIGDRNVHTIEVAQNYIQEKMIDHFDIHGYGCYLMQEKSSEEKIGCITLYNRTDFEGVDIGFALLPEFMRKGYAYEGAFSIMSLAKEKLHLTGVTAFTDKKNIASQKLIEKLGLRFSKIIEWEATKEELLFYEKIF